MVLRINWWDIFSHWLLIFFSMLAIRRQWKHKYEIIVCLNIPLTICMKYHSSLRKCCVLVIPPERRCNGLVKRGNGRWWLQDHKNKYKNTNSEEVLQPFKKRKYFIPSPQNDDQKYFTKIISKIVANQKEID